jgi:AcrR family transcriptional regulator
MSPASTLSRESAQESILRSADQLFYERGIARVGMADVRDSAGVSLRRLYSVYPSKSDLVAAWLEDRHKTWMKWFAESVDGQVEAGVEPVRALFAAIEEWATSPGYRGCAFLNAIAETTEIDDRHRAIVAGHKRALIEHVSVVVHGAYPSAPEWFASALGVLIDGAVVDSAVFGSLAPIADASSAASTLVDSFA